MTVERLECILATWSSSELVFPAMEYKRTRFALNTVGCDSVRLHPRLESLPRVGFGPGAVEGPALLGGLMPLPVLDAMSGERGTVRGRERGRRIDALRRGRVSWRKIGYFVADETLAHATLPLLGKGPPVSGLIRGH